MGACRGWNDQQNDRDRNLVDCQEEVRLPCSVGLAGLEPATWRLCAACSARLSYSPASIWCYLVPASYELLCRRPRMLACAIRAAQVGCIVHWMRFCLWPVRL